MKDEHKNRTPIEKAKAAPAPAPKPKTTIDWGDDVGGGASLKRKILGMSEGERKKYGASIGIAYNDFHQFLGEAINKYNTQ